MEAEEKPPRDDVSIEEAAVSDTPINRVILLLFCPVFCVLSANLYHSASCFSFTCLLFRKCFVKLFCYTNFTI